ncbi:heat-inducible transcriptional repressor HrcA [Spiroplasma endosymbiont of Labia minor]|uniref:heat-inducible transcriptional repressor HrcA n=1 Tax=Spiroplasma endosymbiont of Labia minor TaxID=3066305 RepID=UPI0030D065B2
MLSERQNKVLKAIISEHIKTAQPVGSKTIQELLDIEVSSATIRNDAALLEEHGYLEKSHTSSGRIPSTKGYRYYVENLMDKDDVNDLKAKINIVFEDRSKTIDEVLDSASDIISEMTQLATYVITGLSQNVVSVKKIEVISITEKTAAVIIVLSNGKVENKIFELENILFSDLKVAINFFDKNLVNIPLSEIEAKAKELLPRFSELINQSDLVFQNFLQVIAGFDNSKSHAKGLQYMLTNPEFNDPEKIKSVLTLLEGVSPFEWFDLQIKKYNITNKFSKKTNMLIGLETGTGSDDLAVVEKTIITKAGETASIALVGPKRMKYDKITELLEWVAKKIVNEFDNKKGGE